MSDPVEALIVIEAGRPPTNNRRRSQHWQQTRREVAAWREAAAEAAMVQRTPRFTRPVAVTCWGRYPDRRWLPDPDALAPALKAALDGLVDRRVLADDTAAQVASVTYNRPVVVAGCRPALVITLTETTT